MARTDYETAPYRHYARGRAVSTEQLDTWLAAFAAVLPTRRPLVGLDVGSGTGRFTPALAEAFGPVTGIEPSVQMRSAAPEHAGVTYLAGSAEAMPVTDACADYALLFLSWHHVADQAAAVPELTRVLRPGGRVLLRANFRDHHPRPWWLAYFPRGYEADAAIFQPLHEVIALFTSEGWHVADFTTVTEPSAVTRGEMLERLRLRTLSLFAQLTPEEAALGLRRLEDAVAADPDAPAPTFAEPLLTLERP